METHTDNKRKQLTGTVVSDKMTDTVVVEVERYVRHARYNKFVKYRKKYTAHDPENKHAVGDVVTIEETKPISKRKKFRIV